MYMKHILITLLAMLLSFTALAQLEVKKGSFNEVTGFVNIDLDRQNDINDNPYAVIKVKTENINDEQRHKLLFKSDPQTTIECVFKVGEVWVYISYHAAYIKISGPDMGSTVFYLPYDMQGKKGYEMTLIYKEKKQYEGWGMLTINTKPENDAEIYLNGKLIQQKTPYYNSKMPAGKYDIKVSKFGYYPSTRTIELNAGDNIVAEFEMSVRAIIHVKADNDTEVYIDGVFMKKGDWRDVLDSGNHEIIGKKPNHRDAVCSIFVEDGKNQTIELKPEQIYGILQISSQPSEATVYIDDKPCGKTPLALNDALIGEHDLWIVKEGYKPLRKKYELQENGVLTFNETLINYQNNIKGMFSVSDTVAVYFSKGNLQYKASTKTWRFAECQWDVIGRDNKNISSTYDGWVDLYPYDNIDYGTIINGNDKAWRMLTGEEWNYVIQIRNTTSGILYAKATVNDVEGLILLPDDWDSLIYTLNHPNSQWTKFTENIISESDWIRKFEANGAIFLPAAGKLTPTTRNGIIVSYNTEEVYEEGNYWSSTTSTDPEFANNLWFTKDHYVKIGSKFKKLGSSLRLVCPAE